MEVFDTVGWIGRIRRRRMDDRYPGHEFVHWNHGNVIVISGVPKLEKAVAFVDTDVVELTTLQQFQVQLWRAAIVPFFSDFEGHRARHESQIQQGDKQYHPDPARRREGHVLFEPLNHPLFLAVCGRLRKEIGQICPIFFPNQGISRYLVA